MPRMEDLSPADRRLVEQAIGRRSSKGGSRATHERQRPRPSAATGPSTGEVIGSCLCGETFTNGNQLDRHPAGGEHLRFTASLTLAEDAVTPDP